jgi:hypothetical protein
MKCYEIEILINDYLDNELPAQNKNEFEAHINTCEACKKELEETLLLLEKLTVVPKEAAPVTDLWTNIQTRISTQIPEEKKIISLKPDVKINYGKYQDRPSARNRYMKYAAITLIAAMIVVALLPSLLTDKNAVKIDIFKTSWPVINIKGVTTIDSKLFYGNTNLQIGDWLETKDSARARLDIPGVGSVMIEPNSRVKIVRSDDSEHRIEVDYGTINADINSKPRTFFVDTRSATAIDLGCEYTLTIDKTGDGILYVKEGMVALEQNGRQSLVPAGKFCMSKTGIGPGTPFRKNTSEELKTALIKYDFGEGGSEALNTILKYAKKSDAVTLVNILPRVDEQSKPKVYARVSEFVPPPRRISYDSIPFIKIDELNDWIEKVQEEVEAEVEKTMKELEKNLKDKFNYEFKFDSNMNADELNELIQENVQKHMENLDKLQELYLPTEELNREMEELNKQMEKFNFNYNFNFDYDNNYGFDTTVFNDKMQREMDKVQRKMEKSQRKMEEKMRENERQIELLDKEQEMRDREQEQRDREQERQEELQQRQQEREQELEERQREREQELQDRQREREERMKEKMKQKMHDNNNDDENNDDNE